jgi:hypothetical protein
VHTLKQKLRLIGSGLVLILLAHNAQSAVVLDGFTNPQYLHGGIQSTDLEKNHLISDFGITDTVLGHAQRTFHADSGSTRVIADEGFLSIDTDSTGGASVNYSFDPINLAALANAIALNISFIDLNVEIQMIANDDSVFAFHNFGGVGHYLIDFSQFSDPAAFAQLHSFELQFRGTTNWDAEFDLLATVPEPPVTALLMIGVMAVGLSTRGKILEA